MIGTVWGDNVWAAGVWADGVWADRDEGGGEDPVGVVSANKRRRRGYNTA